MHGSVTLPFQRICFLLIIECSFYDGELENLHKEGKEEMEIVPLSILQWILYS